MKFLRPTHLTLLDTDPEKLKSLISPIDSWLKDHRKQSLNPKKTTLKKLSQGISYLGYRLQQDLNEGGQLKLYAPLHKKYEFIQTLRSFETSWSNSFSDTETGDQKFPIHPLELPHPNKTLQNTVSSLNARLGFLKHAQTKSFRKKSLTRMEDHLTHPEALPLGHYDAWSPVRVRRNFNSFKLR